MRYVCNHCHEGFSDCDVVVKKWEENHGEYFGFPAKETMYEERCPFCYSKDIEEEEEDDELELE